MNNSHKLLWHYFLAIFLALCLTSTVANAASSNALFSESFSNEDGKNIGATIRSRAVNIKVGQLVSQTKRIRNGQAQTSTPQQQITLNLFDGAVVKAQLSNNYVNKSGSSTWIGEISGQENSTAIFLIRDNKVYGVIESPLLGNYSIRPATSSSAHIIEQIKSDAVLSGESDYVIPPQEDKTQTTTRSATSSYNDDGSIIDVYVAYDQDASGGSVSAADAQSYAELFIAYTNKAYKNSGINQRVWLVGNVDGYDHNDTDAGSLDADLDAVKDTMTGLHDKRDEYHADLVLFFTPFTSGTCAGLASLQTTNNDINWQSNAFAVMQACSFGQTVFAHELGHNMGSRHDWYMDNGTTPQTYAHGYVDTTNKFRTIMAYDNRCTALNISGGCTRVAHFSNPSVNYNNNTTGVAAGTSTACQESDANPSVECDADNTTNFNEKALTTANFRDSRITWTGNVSNEWSEANNWKINIGAPGATTIVNRIPRSYDNVYIPSTATSTYPTISTGNVEARGITIESGATLTMTDGTLSVGWNWTDSGGFTATGGTVKFSSSIDITLDSSSTFNHIEIGSGSDSTTVSLNKNIDINGNLTINTGAKLKAGTYTINLAGNWAEQHIAGFDAGSSTMIFDGSSQTATKVTSNIVFNETFSKADNQTCCGTAYLPDNWVREKPSGYGWMAGDGQAVRWNDSSDAWLFTTAKTLSELNTYQLSFKYKNLQGGKTSSFSIYIGTSQNSAAMTTELTSVTGVTGTTFSTATKDFTVSSSGTYYFGIRSRTSDSSYAVIDDFVVNENSDLRFNNLQVASGETDFNANVKVGNNFEIANGGTADFNSNTINVDGSVTNNGSIKQTKSVANNTMSEFVHITNIAGNTNKYYGVEITPSIGSMGSTTVEVKGNQTCASPVSSGVKRCYIITPTTDQTSNVKLYYSSTESNGNTAVNVNVEDSGSWTTQSSTRGGSGDALWAEGANITSYGSFALVDTVGDTTPDSFSFSDQTNVAVSTVITSDTITVAGITGAAAISVTSGEYKIGSGSFTSTAGTVNNGDTVTVQHTSSSSFSTNTDTMLTIGGVSDTFTSTTVAAPVDTTAPTTATLTPIDDATNIAIATNIVIEFSEIVNVNSGNILIKLTSDDSVFATIPVTDAQVTGTGTNTITINPTTDLNYGTDYYVEIETGALRDAANNDFAGISDKTDFNFTTEAAPDTTAPTTSTLTPVDDATNIAIATNIVIEFSEIVNVNSGNILIKLTSDDSVFATIPVTDAQVTGTGTNTITINPTTDLNYGTDYYVEIETLALRDAANNNFAGISDKTDFNFTTEAAPDTTAPTTSTLTPVDDATNIAIATNIVIEFSEIVNVNSGNIFIKLTSDDSVFATIPVTDAQVTGDGTNTITINPTTDLNYGTDYYVEIETGALRDAANNNFAGISDKTDFNFTTEAAPDTTAPTTATLTPVDDATNIAIATNIVIEFSEIVNVNSGNIFIKLTSDDSVFTTIPVTDAQVTGDGTNTITINPTTDLNYGTEYYIEIETGALRDAANNDFAGISDKTYFNFTTEAAPDTTAPTTATLTPADDATNIAIGSNLVIEFSEIVNVNSGNILIKLTSDDSVFATIPVTDAQITGTGTNTITINLTTDLNYGTDYYVEIETGAFRDAANNDFAGISDKTDFNFTTEAAPDTTAPTTATLTPADDATNIAIATNIVIEFSEIVNVNSGNILIKLTSDDSVIATIPVTDAQVTGSGTNTITINPTTDLNYGTLYYVEIATGAFQDAANNNYVGINDNSTWNFTTLNATTPPTEPNIAPTISGNPATVVKVGYSYTFTPTASDDNGDSLTFSISNKPDWATFDTSTGRLSGTPNVVTNYTGIEISVSDGQLSAQLAAFNIEVQADNRSPTISGNPKTQIDVGQNYEFIPTASDPDGDSLSFSIKNKPDWAQFDTATGRLSGQPSQTATTSNIEISVTDGNTTASLKPFNITVNSAAALFKPSQLIVTAAVGGVNPVSQKLRVNYPNGYNRNKLWSYATVNASFAKITSALTSSKWIEWNVSFKTKTLAIGEHNGSITVKTDNGNETVPIVVTILDTAELQLSRSQLNFGGVQGGKTPKKQKIKVSSSGSKILSWSTTTNADWLTIEPSQGTTTSKVKVGINASQLANVGEHTATISFIDSESGNTIDVPITLDVVAANSEEVKLTALEVVQVIQDLNNSIPLIAEKPTFVRAHVSSTTGKSVKNVNAKLTGKNGDTVVFEISPSNDGGSINVSDNPKRSKINDSFLFELPKESSTGNLTLEFEGVDKPFACENCTTTVSFETIPAIDMKLVDIVWLRKFIAPTQKMRQAIPENIYNIYPISTLNVSQSNTPFILNSSSSLKLLRRTIRGLFLRKYFDGPTAEKQYYYGVGGKFYGTVGISFRPGTLGAGAYIKGIDRRVFGHNLKLAYRSDRPCGETVSGSTFSNLISPVATGANAIYGFNAKTKRIYPPTTSDFMTKRTGSWISDYNYKCAIETLKARSTRSARSSRSIRSLVTAGTNTVTINGLITGISSGVIDNLVNAVATTTADAPTAGDYKMSLQTSDSTELAAYPFGPVNINVGGDSDASGASESAYSLILPRPDNMKRIVLYDKAGTKLDERIASENAPTVRLTAPNGGETIQNDAEKLTVTWDANDVDGDTLTYAIDYSLDGGTSWKALVSGYDQKSIEIDVALLAGTSQAKFRVIADDSFNSGSDESDAVFTVEGKDPEVSITSPSNGDLFISGQSINFVGQAYDKEDGKLTGTWSSDRDGDLTTSQLAEDLAEGTHTITLTATDSQNQTSTSTISINVYRERPTSLPATFSVSEDNFTIGGYVNGGTATADLTISNGGDDSLTWSAASDANWLTLSETSGTAPSNIKLIANSAGIAIGVYSGNVILTSDVPGVIAKTIEVTFRVQEALPIASTPVQQVGNNGTNKVDNIIDGGTIPKDKTITGATLRGNIINEGTLKDIIFEGEELKGGTLAGKLTNKGTFVDVKLSENTEIEGGRLQGNITGAANGYAQLDNLEIVDNSQVSNVTLGNNVTFGSGVTLKDVKLMGASLSDVKLEGTIRTASSATVIKDVLLGAKAKVVGGKLAGIIKGDSKAPALLEFLTIEAKSQVSHAIISDGVDIPVDAKLGTGVQFTTAKNIPFNIDLTQTLPSFTNSVAVDLSADPVVGGKGLLVTINDLPAFADLKMDQSDKNGNLQLKIEDLNFAVTPVKVKRVDSKDQSVRLGFGNSVYFKTDDGIEVEAHPAVQDLATLKTLLAAIELPKINITKEGNIQIPVTDKLWFSGRAELASKPSEETVIGFKFKGDLVVLVFEDKDGQKREQVLYPAPASALTEEASLTEEGILSFRTYKGKLDYSVENGEAIESLTITEIADSNGDFLIIYPEGYKQKLFALPAAE
jgi:methionine-rich copper-binding protein CopC